jgi:hypothetical protein
LGGIVFKKVCNLEDIKVYKEKLIRHQAMAIAHARNRYKELLASVDGVIFFGTPHQGSELANFADILLNVLAASGLTRRHKLIRALKRNSDCLFEISAGFVELAQNMQIRTFYETERIGAGKIFRGPLVC